LLPLNKFLITPEEKGDGVRKRAKEGPRELEPVDPDKRKPTIPEQNKNLH
jgi:hypothetical protein